MLFVLYARCARIQHSVSIHYITTEHEKSKNTFNDNDSNYCITLILISSEMQWNKSCHRYSKASSLCH